MSSHARHARITAELGRGPALLQVGERADGVLGEEHQVGERARQEALVVHAPELLLQAVVEARGVQQDDRLVVWPCFFSSRISVASSRVPGPADHDDDRVGLLQEQRLAFGEVARDDHLVGAGPRLGREEVHGDPDQPPAGLLHAVGDHLHQPDVRTAPHEGVPALAEQFGELTGGARVAVVEVGGGEEDADVHGHRTRGRAGGLPGAVPV